MERDVIELVIRMNEMVSDGKVVLSVTSTKTETASQEESLQTALQKIRSQSRMIAQLSYKLSECHSVIAKLEAKNHRRISYRINTGLRQLKARITGRPAKAPKSHMPDLSVINQRTVPNHDTQMVILTTPHTFFVAMLIQDCLTEVGIKAQIIHEEPVGGFSEVLHFVIAPQMFNPLPGFYVAFQVEQSTSQRWFTTKYVQTLNSAVAILDYSLQNLKFLQANGIHAKQCFYLPIAPLKNMRGTDSEFDLDASCDVLFYGDYNCERRRIMLNLLRKKLKIKVVNRVFGLEMHRLIASAKVIINIHYYEQALLETVRINECLSLGKVIVSEKCIDQKEHIQLEQVIEFVDVGDAENLIAAVQKYLLDDELRVKRESEVIEYVYKEQNAFKFYFLRFLLAFDLIDFDQFYTIAGRHVRLGSDHLCLALPEYFERKEAFRNDGRLKFEFFTGLRHQLGWVGCGLSYKFMLKKAQEQKLPRITICEDDVELPPDWDQRYNRILSYLDRNDDWNMFSGLNADLHEDTKVLKIATDDAETFVYLDRTVSTVFNVYHQSVFPSLVQWDSNNRNVHENTIDRFIQRNHSLRVVTTTPFLVGHKEELYSTLWNGKNTIYLDLIKKSEAALRSKVARYEQYAPAPTDQKALVD